MLDKSTIEAIAENHAVNPGARSAQKALAREVTDIVHGTKRRESAERVTDVLFGGSNTKELSDEDIAVLAHEIPTALPGNSVIEALTSSGVVSSNGEQSGCFRPGLFLSMERKYRDRTITKSGFN